MARTMMRCTSSDTEPKRGTPSAASHSPAAFCVSVAETKRVWSCAAARLTYLLSEDRNVR